LNGIAICGLTTHYHYISRRYYSTAVHTYVHHNLCLQTPRFVILDQHAFWSIQHVKPQ